MNKNPNQTNSSRWKFIDFLKKIVDLKSVVTNQTSKGEITIQQTLRNKLRREGLEALFADLSKLYGNCFDVVETKEGIIIVAENENIPFTFSWELKSTIKSLNFDPFIEAQKFDTEREARSNE